MTLTVLVGAFVGGYAGLGTAGLIDWHRDRGATTHPEGTTP